MNEETPRRRHVYLLVVWVCVFVLIILGVAAYQWYQTGMPFGSPEVTGGGVPIPTDLEDLARQVKASNVGTKPPISTDLEDLARQVKASNAGAKAPISTDLEDLARQIRESR